ncbi:DUF6320 domain-containing protein [Bacillus ndiopicus]|uniref:DUF6320 domain-containing protein n=1 Tax=Bacillus ndiopicus TaxID=1347368 RepID=UPI0005AA9814|nr:DUF6320 domain-containing protein [Bacillus ndiopicus]
MNKCEKCKVTLDGQPLRCPLCLKVLSYELNIPRQSLYPIYNNEVAKKSFISKLILCLSIISCSICMLINILIFKKDSTLSFIYVLVVIFCLLIPISHTIKSKRNIGSKIVSQTFGASLAFFVIDFNFGYERWSVNVFIPFIIIISILFSILKMLLEKKMMNEYFWYSLVMVFIGFIPMLLFALNVSNLIWPSAVAALLSTLAFVGNFIFAGKHFKDELIRRFHI